jgi:thiamine pyrophosphate-dependent acetolactate synthase large subunit-like protein
LSFFTEGSIFFIIKFLIMNELELKAILHERIVGIQTMKCLERVLEAINEIQGEEEDWWDELTDEQQKKLEKAIERSRNPANLIAHEDVVKKMAKLLSR